MNRKTATAGRLFLQVALDLLKKQDGVKCSQTLWEACLADDQCIIPTKSQLKDSLKQLRKQKLVQTVVGAFHALSG